MEDDGERLGDCELLGARSVKISQDSAPTSLLFPPAQVLVAVPAVVENAVVNWKAPASTSRSSPRFVQVFPTSSSAATTAIMPPPVAIVVEPVVNAVSLMSVPASAPVEEYAASETL